MDLVHTDISIDVSAERAWAVLADTRRYGEWNPFVLQVEGRLVPGERLDLTLFGMRSERVSFRPIVSEAHPPRLLALRRRLLLPGILSYRHRIELAALSPRRTLLSQRVHFAGLLLPLLRDQLQTFAGKGSRAMNAALKQRAEALPEAGTRPASARTWRRAANRQAQETA